MGKIAKKAAEYYSDPCMVRFKDYIDEIESQIEALRQEIQDLKMDNIRGGSISSPEAPEPELQRGDFVSFIPDGSVPCRKKGDKVWGVFHHQDGNKVWAHWQNSDRSFPDGLSFILRKRVTFEFRPEK